MNRVSKPEVNHWWTRLCRRIMPISQDRLLSAEEYYQTAVEVNAYRDRFWRSGLLLAFVIGFAFVLLLKSFPSPWMGPVDEPVYVMYLNWFWMVPVGFLIFGVARAFEVFYLTRLNPRIGDRVHRYESTKYGYDAHKVAKLKILLSLVFSLLLGFFLASLEKVVDRRGFTFWNNMRIVHEPYDNVSQIWFYDSGKLRSRKGRSLWLCIDFKDGHECDIYKSGSNYFELVERVANIVSERSGVPIKRGTRKPESWPWR